VLARWFKLSYSIIKKIWGNNLFADYSLPASYALPDYWVRRAEKYYAKSPYFRFLGSSHRKSADKVVSASSLSSRKKRFLYNYISGDTIQTIANQNKMNRSSVRETIFRALVRLYKDARLVDRDWFRVLLKGKFRLGFFQCHLDPFFFSQGFLYTQ
jgi:hypothetical protein